MKCFRKSDQKHFVALRWGMPRRLCFVCLHSGYLICIWDTLRSHFGPNLIHRAPNNTFLSPFLDGEEGSGCYEGQGEASGQYDKPTSVTEEARGPPDDGEASAHHAAEGVDTLQRWFLLEDMVHEVFGVRAETPSSTGGLDAERIEKEEVQRKHHRVLGVGQRVSAVLARTSHPQGWNKLRRVRPVQECI